MNELTQEVLKQYVTYDKETGEMVRIKSGKGFAKGRKLGALTGEGYLQANILGKSYKVHRLAWLYVYGEFPVGVIDHINGIKADNSIKNLRDVAPLLNSQNRRYPNKDGRSGYLGVTLEKGKYYRARIRSHGKLISLGLFQSGEAAHSAYLKAKRELHEGCQL